MPAQQAPRRGPIAAPPRYRPGGAGGSACFDNPTEQRKYPGGCVRRYFGYEPPRSAMRVALAQIDPTVGAIDANAAKVAEWIGRARDQGAELVIFPELCIPGYPAEDLYLKRHFLAANQRAVEELAQEARGTRAVVACAERVAEGGDARHAHSSTAVLADGAVQA